MIADFHTSLMIGVRDARQQHTPFFDDLSFFKAGEMMRFLYISNISGIL